MAAIVAFSGNVAIHDGREKRLQYSKNEQKTKTD